MVLGYKQFQRVEQAWRTLKSRLRPRPVYYWSVHRITPTWRSRSLRCSSNAAPSTPVPMWRNIRDGLKLIKLAQWSSPNRSVWQVTEPTQEAAKRLRSLQIKKSPPILDLV